MDFDTYEYDHPEKCHKDLVFVSNGKIPEEVLESRPHLRTQHANHRKTTQLCRACGWNSYHELYSGYDPRVKVFHARDNIGLWQLGPRWVLRDQPNDDTFGNDYMTQQFIRSHPTLASQIPVLKEMRLLSEPEDPIQLTLMTQAQGERLDYLWHTLTRDQKYNYTMQLAEIIKNLRQCQAPTAQKVNGERLDDMALAECHSVRAPTCKKIGATDDEWFENIELELRHGLAEYHGDGDLDLIEAKIKELKDNFPPSAPYVLSHGDLHLSNVIVKDDKIEAIIDWEISGFHPWWVEAQRMGLAWPAVDEYDDELLAAAWKHIQPDVGRDALSEVLRKQTPILRAWNRCMTDHLGWDSGWQRPDFCKCQPFAGHWRARDLGKPCTHKIRNFNPALVPKKTTAVTEEASDS